MPKVRISINKIRYLDHLSIKNSTVTDQDRFNIT